MESLRNLSSNFDRNVSSLMGPVDNNAYMTTGLALFVVLYACRVAPRLPDPISRVLATSVGKLAFFFVIAYLFSKNPTTAAASSVGLVALLYVLSNGNFGRGASWIYNYVPGSETVLRCPTSLNDGSVAVADEGSAGIRPGYFSDDESCHTMSSFPQYANMKTDSYEARDNIDGVSGYDSTAAYSSI